MAFKTLEDVEQFTKLQPESLSAIPFADEKKTTAIPLNRESDGSIKYTFDNIYDDKQLVSTIKDYYLFRTGKQFKTDAEAVNEYISDSTFRQANTLGSVFGDLSLVGIDEVNSRQKANLAYLLNYWQQLPNFYEEGGRGFSGFLSNLGYAIIDPINVIGGIVGGFAAKTVGKKAVEAGVKELVKASGKKGTKDIVLKQAFIQEQAKQLSRKKLLSAAGGAAAVDATGLAISDVYAQTTEKEVGLIESMSPTRTGLVAITAGGLSFLATAGIGYGTRYVLNNLNNNKIKLPKNLQNTIDKTANATDESVNHPSNIKYKTSYYKTKLLDQYDYFKVLQEQISGVKGSVAGLKEAYVLRAELPKAKARKQMDPVLNPYFQLRMTAASGQRATEFINDGFYLPPSKNAYDASYIKTNNLGLNQILKQYDDTGEIPIFLQYVAAKRQQSIVNYYKKKKKKLDIELPLSNDEVTKLIDFAELSQSAYKNKYKEDLTRQSDFLKGLKELKLFTDDALNYLVAKEVISKTQAADMLAVNSVFIPWYRTKKVPGITQTLKEQTLKIMPLSASARTRLAKVKQEGELNLYDNLISYVYSNVAAADRNAAKVSLYEMLERGVSSGKLKANYFESGNLKGQIRDFLDLDGNVIVSRVLPKPEYTMAISKSVEKALERAGVKIAGKGLGDEPIQIAAFSSTIKSVDNPDNVIDILYRNGKQTFYEVKDRNFIEAYQSIGDKTSDFVNFMSSSSIFAKYSRLASRAITYSPPFVAFNFIRDTLSGAINSAFGLKFVPGFSTAKGLINTYTKTDAYRRAFVNGMGYASRADSTSILKSATDDIYSYGKDDVSKFYVDSLGKYFKMFGAGWRGYKDFVGRMEYATRFAEFQYAKDTGLSDMAASFAGREIATDFAMKGSSRWLNLYARNTMFLNAALQGLYRGGRVFFEQPKKAIPVMFATVVAPEYVLHNLNKKYKEYDQVDERVKQLNYLIPIFKKEIDPQTGLPVLDHYLPIPKPYDFGIFANLYVAFSDGLQKKSSYVTQQYIKSSFGNILPNFTLPTALNPLLELALNKNFYTGRPIESYYEMTKMSDLKRRTGVRGIAQQLSNLTANLRGMVAAEGKVVEPLISPITVDYVLRAYLTGIMQYPLDIYDHYYYEKTLKGVRGEKPARRSDEARIVENPLSLITRRFNVEIPLTRTKFHEDFYNLYNKARKYKQLNLADLDDKENINTKLDLFEVYLENTEKFKENGLFQEEELTNLSAVSPTLATVANVLNKGKQYRLAISRDTRMSAEEKRNIINEVLTNENELLQTVVEQLATSNIPHIFEDITGRKTVVPRPNE